MGTVLGWNPPDVHLPRLDTYLMSLCSVTVYRLYTTPLLAQKKKISSGHLVLLKKTTFVVGVSGTYFFVVVRLFVCRSSVTFAFLLL